MQEAAGREPEASDRRRSLGGAQRQPAGNAHLRHHCQVWGNLQFLSCWFQARNMAVSVLELYEH